MEKKAGGGGKGEGGIEEKRKPEEAKEQVKVENRKDLLRRESSGVRAGVQRQNGRERVELKRWLGRVI